MECKIRESDYIIEKIERTNRELYDEILNLKQTISNITMAGKSTRTKEITRTNSYSPNELKGFYY